MILAFRCVNGCPNSVFSLHHPHLNPNHDPTIIILLTLLTMAVAMPELLEVVVVRERGAAGMVGALVGAITQAE